MFFKRWFTLFWQTLLIGMLAAVLIGVYWQLTDPELILDTGWKWFTFYFENSLAGITFGVLSLMGFFAYLILNYIARSSRRPHLWVTMQWIIVVITFFDLIYLRVVFLEGSWLGYTVLPAILIALSAVVAFRKVQLTNKSGFTPTIFFMFVATTLEAFPALRENDPEATLFMIIPLFLCNAWQILNLQKLVSQPKG